MGFLFALCPWLVPYRQIVEIGLALALAAAVAFYIHHVREEGVDAGRAEVRAEWNAEKLAQAKVDMAAAQENTLETKRRMAKQQENQDAQNQELARARADAAHARAVAVRVQHDSQTAAEQWRARLADSPTRADLEAAGATIGVLTDMLGKSRERSSVLATYADAARAAGLKCERDYDALTVKP